MKVLAALQLTTQRFTTAVIQTQFSGNTVYWGEGLSEHFNKPVDLSFRAGFWSDFEILVMGGGGAAPYNQAEGTSFETKGTNYFYKEAELCEKGREYAAFECKSIE